MWEYSEQHSASVLQLGASVDEESRKAIAHYAYHLDRQIRDIWFSDGRMFVRTRAASPLDADLRRSILTWTETLATRAPTPDVRVLRERSAARLAGGSPLADLRRSGQVIEEGPGLIALQGPLLAFRGRLDEWVRREALACGAVEQEYPPALGLDALVRSGYVRNFPQHVFFLSEMDRRPASCERVQAAGPADVDDPSRMDGALSTSTLVMSPTICYHCFRVHQGSSLPAERRLYTALGKCCRKEPFAGSLDRLQVFTMREIIAFGSSDEVEAQRAHWMDVAWQLASRLDLTARLVTAFDPFFGAAASNKKVYQALVEAKYELQVLLPEEDRWCAVASFNHHAGTLTRAFDIHGDGEAPLQSGCVGFGYERLAVAVTSQHGLALSGCEAALGQAS